MEIVSLKTLDVRVRPSKLYFDDWKTPFGYEEYPYGRADIPFLDSNRCWRAKIDIDAGRVIHWPIGATADIFWEVKREDVKSDIGCCHITLSDNCSIIAEYRGGVPRLLNTGGAIDGYINININRGGYIRSWNANGELDAFLRQMGLI